MKLRIRFSLMFQKEILNLKMLVSHTIQKNKIKTKLLKIYLLKYLVENHWELLGRLAQVKALL